MPTRFPRLRASLRTLGFLAAGLTFAAVYLVALWKAPTFLLNQDLLRDPNTRPEHRLSAEHNARLIVISIGGALVVLAGLLYTARNYRLAHRGQVTERFTKALERLESEAMYIRIGGIHALEHVMRDSPEHHGDVVEVLAAFVRDRTRSRIKWEERREYEGWPDGDEDQDELEPDSDIAAALTALAHRPHRPTRQRGRVDLHDLMLGRASLMGADLREVDLWGTYLVRADLVEARLDGADFGPAWLERAELTGASLRSASLIGTRLTGAQMAGANLGGAFLQRADLRGALLKRADLRGADLKDAHLEGADLSSALIEADQVLTAFIDANTTLPGYVRHALYQARSTEASGARQVRADEPRTS